MSPLVVPALLLVALTATSVGYAIASLLPQQIANLLTQVLVVFVLMFSPLNFPAERLPDWLATIHQFLPVQAMGEVIRGTVASNVFPLTLEPFVVLTVWCIAGFGISVPGAEPPRLTGGSVAAVPPNGRPAPNGGRDARRPCRCVAVLDSLLATRIDGDTG